MVNNKLFLLVIFVLFFGCNKNDNSIKFIQKTYIDSTKFTFPQIYIFDDFQIKFIQFVEKKKNVIFYDGLNEINIPNIYGKRYNFLWNEKHLFEDYIDYKSKYRIIQFPRGKYHVKIVIDSLDKCFYLLWENKKYSPNKDKILNNWEIDSTTFALYSNLTFNRIKELFPDFKGKYFQKKINRIIAKKDFGNSISKFKNIEFIGFDFDK